MSRREHTKVPTAIRETKQGVRFLSVGESAELLRVSKATIKRYLAQKQLRRIKCGRRTLISFENLMSLLREE